MAAAVLTGCTSNTQTETDSAADTSGENSDQSAGIPAGPMELVVGCQNDIGSMYPFGSATSGVKVKRVMCYETLYWLDYDGNLQPILAKNYESLGDGKYAIELFDYIYDSDGNHMTAADIVFTLDKYIEDGQNLSTYATLKDYHATGEYTLELTFDPETVGQFVILITNMHCITEKAWNDSGDDMAAYPVGTGGYTLNKAESVLGSTYVFDKRDEYWQTDEKYINDYNKMTLNKLTAKIITDASTLAIALETGEIDFAYDIAAADQGLFTNVDGTAANGYIMLEGANNAFTHLLFNCGDKSPLKDIKLRQAICYAIDSAACAYTAYGAFGQVCNSATNPNLKDADLSMGRDGYYPFDVAKAEALVKESSYNGETLKILVQPIATVSCSAALLQQYCADIGVKVELLEYDMALYRTTRNDETGEVYDIELYGAASAGDLYVYTTLKELDVKNYKNGICHIFTEDKKLQELYDGTADVDANSPETVKALLDYIDEQCYMYGMYYCPKLFFGKDFITYGRSVIYLDGVFTAFITEKS
jgi:ABC-type transport system substrate-binding protein